MLRERIARIRSRSKFNFYKLLLGFIVVTGFTFVPVMLSGPMYISLMLAGIAGVAIPILFRKRIVASKFLANTINIYGYSIIILWSLYGREIKHSSVNIQSLGFFFFAAYFTIVFIIESAGQD